MQVLIKRIQKRGASSFCVDMWERVIWGGLTSLLHPLCPAALQPCFHILPLSRQAALVYLNIRRSHRVNARKRIERHSTYFFHLLSLHPCQAKPLQAVFKRGSDQPYLYTYQALRRKTVIVSSRRERFIGILLTAVKILSFDCQLVREWAEKTWGPAFTSLRLRPSGLIPCHLYGFVMTTETTPQYQQ